MDLHIEHQEADRRYLLFSGETVVAYADYRLSEDGTVADFHHTVTIPEYRGNGLAAELAQRVLDDVRTAGRTVRTSCWYMDDFVRDHPEFHDLRA